MTLQLIETKTLGTAASAIEFTSIPSDGTDLLAVISCRTNRGSEVDGLSLNLNGSSASFSGRYLEGNGSSVVSATSTVFAGLASGNTTTSNTFGNSLLYIPNYTGSTNKSFSADAVSENNATVAGQAIIAGLWSNTAAITSLRIAPLAGTELSAGSTISLYKITKGTDGTTVVS